MRVPFKIVSVFLSAVIAPVVLHSSAPSITISPGFTTVGVTQTLQYTASVVGLTNSKIQWEVNGLVGGSTTSGTISTSGLFKAPAQIPTGNQGTTIKALGSDGKTFATVAVHIGPIGPSIRSITPNPIPPGTYTITVLGLNFVPGAIVRNGAVNLKTTYVGPGTLTATGSQVSTQTGVFQIANPGSSWGPAVSVPFKTTGSLPQIAPKAVYVHLGSGQQFTSATANDWTVSAGTISQTGFFVAPSTMPASNTVTVTATGPGGSVTAKVVLAAGTFQAITPKTPTLTVGQKQQFTSSGAVVWSASLGTITPAGLYTAPAVWPASGIDQISVNGPQGNATEQVYITPPVPTITGVSNGGQIPLGLFSITVAGKNFSPGSQAEIYGVGLPTTYANGQLKVTGFFSKVGPTTLKVLNRTVTSAPYAVQIGLANPKVSPAAARRFLQQAAFGPTPNDAEYLQAVGFPGWLNWQFTAPQVSSYKSVTAQYGGMPQQFLTNAVNQPDQLRQRVAFALSQIFVTSLTEVSNPTMINYQDMLLTDAFSNYQQIMTDVTLSPAMGQYLNMGNNAKADPVAGSLANENFAREMMQLFTLGTSMLNPDGTVQVDSNNIPIPTYSQFTVTEFARVYTGWTYPTAPGVHVVWNNSVTNYGPMVPYADEHDSGSKQLLNGYISPAGVTPQVDLKNALANIFNHPNIGPFVSTQLIQHLVKSNPSPAYVGRVAAAFKNNGSGIRGDMKAVISAILLDPEARENDEGENDLASDGHLQEPALFIAGMVRAFGGQMNDQSYYSWDLSNLGQNIFASPSVFNYYAPGFHVEGTSLVGGEFQINSPNNAVLRANEVSNLFSQWANPVESYGPGTTVDVTPYLYLAPNPTALVNALDLTLTRGVMPATMKDAIVTAVAGESGGNLRRVERACYLILSSGYYNVWH